MKLVACLLIVAAFVCPTHGRKKRKPTPKKEEVAFEEWADKGQVTHIFGSKVFKKMRKKTTNGILVMFYAPWCGHCKKMKPEYAQASTQSEDLELIEFGAVDCTNKKNKGVCSQAGVGSFPTIKFYDGPKGRGVDFEGSRDLNGLLKFSYEVTEKEVPDWLTTAIETAEAEAAEKARLAEEADKAWKEGTDVVHLTDSDFAQFRQKNPKMMAFFYAPWCGHCKAQKPNYMEAAGNVGAGFKFTAIDCTDPLSKEVCAEHEVTGYPTIKTFSSSSAPPEAYSGPRSADGFMTFATVA